MIRAGSFPSAGAPPRAISQASNRCECVARSGGKYAMSGRSRNRSFGDSVRDSYRPKESVPSPNQRKQRRPLPEPVSASSFSPGAQRLMTFERECISIHTHPIGVLVFKTHEKKKKKVVGNGSLNSATQQRYDKETPKPTASKLSVLGQLLQSHSAAFSF